jgi:hypothetical protein
MTDEIDEDYRSGNLTEIESKAALYRAYQSTIAADNQNREAAAQAAFANYHANLQRVIANQQRIQAQPTYCTTIGNQTWCY